MIKIFNFGGGVQSTACLVLQAQGKLNYDVFVFADVGADSENPDTLDYVDNVAIPFAESHGIDLVKVHAIRKGKRETVRGRIVDAKKKMIPIPVYGSITGAPMPRRCTEDFKIIPVAKWTRAQGHKQSINALGISLDEIYRAKTKEPKKVAGVLQHIEYPLIDLEIRRSTCMKIIKDAGLPVPPRSACYFCPYHSTDAWLVMKENRPDLFAKAVELEKIIQDKERERSEAKGNYNGSTYYLHRRGLPLDKAVGLQSNFFDELENCESGYCMT